MGRQKRKEYAFYAVLAGTFLLITGAYGSGEKSVQQSAKEMGAVAEKAVAEPEYVPAVRLYAGIFTKLDGEEYAVIEKIRTFWWLPQTGDILMSRMFIHFYRDQSPGERDGHGPVNGAISMCAAIILAISGADCAVWQIYTVHFQVIPVRRGTCFCMQERSPVTHRRKRSVRSAGAI